MKITETKINEIAEQLDCGLKCFLNKSSGALIFAIPDEDFDGEITQIKENSSDYFEFSGMNSRESFNVMMDFAKGINDKSLQTSLINSLNSKSPFRSFKSMLDSSESCRQKWFDYKRERYHDHVRMQIPEDWLK